MNESISDCLAVMEALIEYRQKPISNDLQKGASRYSMLHLDVLTLLYYFAETGAGEILEIGPYVGGSTIAARRSTPSSRTVNCKPSACMDGGPGWVVGLIMQAQQPRLRIAQDDEQVVVICLADGDRIF